jgi:homopolymeric O-antigen transport system permease protein
VLKTSEVVQEQRLPQQKASTLRPSQRTTVIQRTSGWSALNLRDVWEYRDLLYFMTVRDLKARYRQTVLGPLWILLQPLFSMVLYTFLFGVIAKLPSGNSPYAIFAYVALLPWDFFTDSVGSGTNSLLGSKELITKVYFPRLIVPISRIFSSLADFCFSLLILIGMLIYFQKTPNWGVVLVPFFLLLAAMTGLGFGLLFSGLIVKYRDVGNIVSYIVRAWMYLAPVVYSEEIVPKQLLTLYRLNPMTSVVEGFRWAFLNEPPPDWTMVAITFVIATIVLVAGVYSLKRVERNIVDFA